MFIKRPPKKRQFFKRHPGNAEFIYRPLWKRWFYQTPHLGNADPGSVDYIEKALTRHTRIHLIFLQTTVPFRVNSITPNILDPFSI